MAVPALLEFCETRQLYKIIDVAYFSILLPGSSSYDFEELGDDLTPDELHPTVSVDKTSVTKSLTNSLRMT